jgi:hypothetical protein
MTTNLSLAVSQLKAAMHIFATADFAPHVIRQPIEIACIHLM